jgi:predicted transcriptional regulator
MEDINTTQDNALRREAISLLKEHGCDTLAAIVAALEMRNEAIEYAQQLLISSSNLVDSLEGLSNRF